MQSAIALLMYGAHTQLKPQRTWFQVDYEVVVVENKVKGRHVTTLSQI